MQKHRYEELRYIINVYGIVQGVGFRPYLYNKAMELGLKGYVNNDGSRLVIDVEGASEAVKELAKRIVFSPPPLAKVESLRIKKEKMFGYTSFDIRQSSNHDVELGFISRDTAICSDCKADIMDPGSRWFGYAFTNCTNCGPRYSIIKELPYDRCSTTMESFKMCKECQREYESPSSRRFHAQPVCCEVCGPELQLLDAGGKRREVDNVIKAAATLLKEGKLLAVKGLGGFHLMCDATNTEAIARLRSRKRRPHRPLAVMAADIASVEKQCIVSEEERQLLQSPQCPILLLRKKPQCSLPHNIAEDTDAIGMMLPCTPLQLLLFGEGLGYLVATSGNLSGQPIEYENDKALHSLGDIVDYFLVHNRDIHVPIDDSVTKVFQNQEAISRLGRGYAPLSMKLDIKPQLIALGAEQKSTISMSRNGYIYTSQYLGDIKSLEAYDTYKKVLKHLVHILGIKPEAYVHDLHPQYLSTQYAKDQPLRNLGIQHHYAHMASCMAEHKIDTPAIGIIYDGTGLGADGHIWGGELLVGDLGGYTRAGHLRYCSLQGGDKAVEEPWRTALSYVHDLGYEAWQMPATVEAASSEAIQSALRAGFNCFRSSSMGRLFDCVSAILGLCCSITYDAQAAIRLEQVADKTVQTRYDYEIYREKDCFTMDYRLILTSILDDIQKGRKAPVISARFHNTLVDMTITAVKHIERLHGLKTVVMSGGCFENLLLLEGLVCGLQKENFTVYYNQKLPCNDGGISFGQLTAANKILRE